MRHARTILVALAANMLLAGCTGSNGAPSVPTTAPSRTNLQPKVEAATCRDKAGDGSQPTSDPLP